MDKGDESHILEICNGPNGCPNAIDTSSKIYDDISEIFKRLAFGDLMKTDRGLPVKRHHKFVVSISFCPNACSRPQIADIGLIGAGHPEISDMECTRCGACMEACIENAVKVSDESGPVIHKKKCLSCGKCVKACPTGTLITGKMGYRALLGGRLGRHPRLAAELGGIFSETEILAIIEKSLNIFIENYGKIKRFADLFDHYKKEDIFKKILP